MLCVCVCFYMSINRETETMAYNKGMCIIINRDRLTWETIPHISHATSLSCSSCIDFPSSSFFVYFALPSLSVFTGFTLFYPHDKLVFFFFFGCCCFFFVVVQWRLLLGGHNRWEFTTLIKTKKQINVWRRDFFKFFPCANFKRFTVTTAEHLLDRGGCDPSFDDLITEYDQQQNKLFFFLYFSHRWLIETALQHVYSADKMLRPLKEKEG